MLSDMITSLNGLLAGPIGIVVIIIGVVMMLVSIIWLVGIILGKAGAGRGGGKVGLIIALLTLILGAMFAIGGLASAQFITNGLTGDIAGMSGGGGGT